MNIDVMSKEEFNFKLVEEVWKHPCLYNNRIVEYGRKEFTNKAWKEVGEKLNLPGSECKEKWTNLRAVFIRHMKKIQNPSERSRKPYYLIDAMQFTVPYIDSLNKEAEDVPVKVQIQVEGEVNGDHEENLLNLPNNCQLPSDCSSPESHPSISSQQSLLPSPQPSNQTLLNQLNEKIKPAQENKKAHIGFKPPSTQLFTFPTSSHQTLPLNQPFPGNKIIFVQPLSSNQANNMNKRPQEDDTCKTVSECLKAKKDKLEETTNLQHDANKMFLLSLLPDMNQMTQSQVRKFKMKVMNVLDEILDSSAS